MRLTNHSTLATDAHAPWIANSLSISLKRPVSTLQNLFLRLFKRFVLMSFWKTDGKVQIKNWKNFGLVDFCLWRKKLLRVVKKTMKKLFNWSFHQLRSINQLIAMKLEDSSFKSNLFYQNLMVSWWWCPQINCLHPKCTNLVC